MINGCHKKKRHRQNYYFISELFSFYCHNNQYYGNTIVVARGEINAKLRNCV